MVKFLFFFGFHVKQFFNKNYSKKIAHSCMVSKRILRTWILFLIGDFIIHNRNFSVKIK
jgi:choline kinase